MKIFFHGVSCLIQVHLVSDVEEVALRMLRCTLLYSQGLLTFDPKHHQLNLSVGRDHKICSSGRMALPWLEENLLGCESDWEKHAMIRGATMYRAVLRMA